MQTFNEFLLERHPDLNESFWKNMALAGALAGGIGGAGYYAGQQSSTTPAKKPLDSIRAMQNTVKSDRDKAIQHLQDTGKMKPDGSGGIQGSGTFQGKRLQNVKATSDDANAFLN